MREEFRSQPLPWAGGYIEIRVAAPDGIAQQLIASIETSLARDLGPLVAAHPEIVSQLQKVKPCAGCPD